MMRMRIYPLSLLCCLLGIGAAYAGSASNTAPTAAPESTPKAAGAPPGASLEAVYKREFAFLDTQKKELQRLLNEFAATSAADERRLDRKISALQNRIMEISLQAKRLEKSIIEAEQHNSQIQENESLLEMTFTQAETSLADYGLSSQEMKNSELSDADKLAQLFDRAQQALIKSAGLHQRDGKFFLEDGTEVPGRLIFVGNIAAYGVSPSGSGLLIPAGEGRLKLLNKPGGAKTANALAEGESLSHFSLFLFENLNKAVEIQAEKTWRGILNDGGPIAWIIAGLGALGGLLILVRLGIIIGAGRGGKKQVNQVLHEMAQGDKDQLLTTLPRAPGAYARVLEASIAHLQMPEDEWEIAVSDALLQQSVRLDRFSGLILVIAAVAPLLGLLGTVTGMISTFDVITQFGTGDPKLLATGISIALITTQVGLIVAIPTLLLGNVLNGWSSSLKNDLELAALGAREAAQDHTSPAELEETLAEEEAQEAPRTAFAGT